MANKRMISKTICTSIKIAKLKTDQARLLFTWLIPHCDDDGRLQGEEIYIKGIVFPLKKCILKKVSEWLLNLADEKLILWYTDKDGDNKYLQVMQWEKFQTVRNERYKPSELPEYNSDLHTCLTSVTPLSDKCTCNLTELNLTKLNKDQQEEKQPPAAVSLKFSDADQEQIKKLLKTLAKVRPDFNCYKFFFANTKQINNAEDLDIYRDTIIYTLQQCIKYLPVKVADTWNIRGAWGYAKNIYEKHMANLFEQKNIQKGQDLKDAPMDEKLKNLLGGALKNKNL